MGEKTATAAIRPLVSVYGLDGERTGKQIPLPDVFQQPIRVDLVRQAHNRLHTRVRIPHGVSTKAGHQTSAESWGTGRAVARIPRVRGGGTHRSGQAAFGNMCRGGHMFAPKRVYRKIRQNCPHKVREFALASAIAASALPAIVEAKGHAIEKVPEFPLVVSNEMESIKKTKEAVALMAKIGAKDDCDKAWASTTMRAGKGKRRNRRWVQKKGPLIVFKNDNGVAKSFRSIPGVSLMRCNYPNLLRLAPGGTMGRFIIWTEDAFEYLNEHFKNKTNLPIMKTSDLRGIIKNLAQKECVRPPIYAKTPKYKKVNPFKHEEVMAKLNPGYAEWKKALIKKKADREKQRVVVKKKVVKKTKVRTKKPVEA